MTRRCKTCGQEKPLNKYNFTSRRVRGKLYYDYRCRTCYNAFMRDWYKALDDEARGRIVQRATDWRKNHRDEYNQYQQDYRRRNA